MNREPGVSVPGRLRGMLMIAGVAVIAYILFGVIGSVSGSGPKEAWLYPLPVIVAVSLGMAIVRYRRG